MKIDGCKKWQLTKAIVIIDIGTLVLAISFNISNKNLRGTASSIIMMMLNRRGSVKQKKINDMDYGSRLFCRIKQAVV